MDLLRSPLAAACVADDPAHGVTARHRDQYLTWFERNVGDMFGRGNQLVDGADGIGIDLHRVEEPVRFWTRRRRLIGRIDDGG